MLRTFIEVLNWCLFIWVHNGAALVFSMSHTSTAYCSYEINQTTPGIFMLNIVYLSYCFIDCRAIRCTYAPFKQATAPRKHCYDNQQAHVFYTNTYNIEQ